VIARCRKVATFFRKTQEARGGHFFRLRCMIATGSFFLDESSGHERVGGCGWKFAGEFIRSVAGSSADFGGIAIWTRWPNAGAFDGILGVVLAMGWWESLEGMKLPFGIEVVGFSEEEGVRFGVPFIGAARWWVEWMRNFSTAKMSAEFPFGRRFRILG